MIPTMRTIPPPPPKKKSIWKRYANGEKLNPSYDHIPLRKPVIDESKIIRTEPIRVKDNGRVRSADKLGMVKPREVLIILLMVAAMTITIFILKNTP